MDTKPLTPEQKAQVNAWENDPDPVTRLKSNYYPFSRDLLMYDYYQDMAAAGEDLTLIDEAKADLTRKLIKLNADYDADVDLSIELHLAMCNCFGLHVEVRRK